MAGATRRKRGSGGSATGMVAMTFFWLGGREHELQVRRGFLDKLLGGAFEAFAGHHVRFVDDVGS